MSFKGNNEERVIQSKSDNIEIMINDKEMKFQKNFSITFFQISKLIANFNKKLVTSYLTVFTYCITNVIK